MGIQLFKRLTVTDRNGRVVSDSGIQPSLSYLLQFLRLVAAFWTEGGIVGVTNANYTATDIANSSQNIWTAAQAIQYIGRANAGVGIDAYGIVVGINTGATAESNVNYALDTIIANGVGAGQLNYRAVTFVAPRVVGGNIDLDISRPFINESGGTITVKEIGIYCKNVTTTKYFALLRDVTADTDVDDDETLTVVYTLRTTA